jgi:hypothetical protein
LEERDMYKYFLEVKGMGLGLFLDDRLRNFLFAMDDAL